MTSAHSKAISNLIGNCPSCQGLVRIPVDVRSDITVRCPHCSSSFPIAAVLEDVPQLEIIETGAKEDTKVPRVDQVLPKDSHGERKKFVVPVQLAKGSKRRRHRSGSSVAPLIRVPRSSPHRSQDDQVLSMEIDQVQAIDTNSASTNDPLDFIGENVHRDLYGSRRTRYNAASTSDGDQPSPRVRVHSSQRRRRTSESSRNQPLEFIKIAAGGVLAFPIAYLILLWGVKQDPLKIAPAISRAVPFMVPAKMRVKPTSDSLRDSDPSDQEEWIEPGISPQPNLGIQPQELLLPQHEILLPQQEPLLLQQEMLNLPDVAPGEG